MRPSLALAVLLTAVAIGQAGRAGAMEGRPPPTLDLQDGDGGTVRYGLSEWTQEGMTAAYTFLYAV